MKLTFRDISPPFTGFIIGLPIYVLMNMTNLYFQPDEVFKQMNAGAGNLTTVFLIGKLISLFISVFVAAGIAFMIRSVQTPWTFRILCGVTILLSIGESIANNYSILYSLAAIISCLLAVVLSKKFIYKF